MQNLRNNKIENIPNSVFIDDIYTPIEEAKEEIQKRWKDKDLQAKIEEFIGTDIPGIFNEGPFAVLGRHVVTSNIETLRFVELAKKSDLNLLGFEYLNDRFLTSNKSKLSLGKISIISKKNRSHMDNFNIIDLQSNNGKKFSEILTHWGETLINFHHKLLAEHAPEIKLVDMSDWIKKRGERAVDFYPHYLAMFLRNGILFDNYVLKGNESDFTKEVFLPSYKKVCDHFKIKPLIVQLLPEENEDDVSWCFYEVHNIITK